MRFKVLKEELIDYLRKEGISFSQMATVGHVFAEIRLPDFIILEGEPVEEMKFYPKEWAENQYENKPAPQLPEEMSVDKYWVAIETINAIIRYLKHRERN